MTTQKMTSFEFLQMVADDAMDWHDLKAMNRLPTPSQIVMDGILHAQNHMLEGCRILRNPKESELMFRHWAKVYDLAFMSGSRIGMVPRDKNDRDTLHHK